MERERCLLDQGPFRCGILKPSEQDTNMCTNIIITINLYGAYIPRNLNSEAQQNKIIKHSHEQGRAKLIIRARDNRRFMVEMQFGINMS